MSIRKGISEDVRIKVKGDIEAMEKLKAAISQKLTEVWQNLQGDVVRMYSTLRI